MKNTRRKSRISKISVSDMGNAKVFQKFVARKLVVNYENVGIDSNVKLFLDELVGTGELPLIKKDLDVLSFLKLEMASTEGKSEIKVLPTNYEIDVVLDNLTYVLDFIAYDSEYVSNKIMPKKRESLQNIGVFPSNCRLKLGALTITGEFYVNYLKDYKNPVANEVADYLLADEEEEPIMVTSPTKNQRDKSNLNRSSIRVANSSEDILQQIADKEIKVNAQNLQIFLNGEHLGQLSRLYFARL